MKTALELSQKRSGQRRKVTTAINNVIIEDRIPAPFEEVIAETQEGLLLAFVDESGGWRASPSAQPISRVIRWGTITSQGFNVCQPVSHAT